MRSPAPSYCSRCDDAMRTHNPATGSLTASLDKNLILTNCSVVSMTDRAPASTVVVHGGIIRAIGDHRLVAEFQGSQTPVVDCGGRTVTPGLIDGHSHPVLGAERAIGLDLGEVVDAVDLLSRLRAEANRLRAASDHSWLRAWNLDYAAFETLALDASSIENAVQGMPALILFFDGHTALASTKAMALSGVSERTLFDDNSQIVLNSARQPTGELREESAINVVLNHAPALSRAEIQRLARAVLQRMSAAGLTGLCAMDGNDNTFDTIRTLDAEESGMPVRIVTAFDHHPGDGDELIAHRLATLGDRHGRRWRSGLVKLYADGIIDTGTGWLYEPDARGDGKIGLWGDPENLFRTMLHYSRGGLQIATHAIGDRAVGATIDAYLACGVTSARGAAHRIEHIECLTDTDLDRLAAAQISASLQPSHLQWRKDDASDEWSSRLGPQRATKAWRAGDLLAAGVPVALGSDWPVAQFDPRISMAWARLRRTPGHPDAVIFEPEQRLTALQALHGFTVGAALAQGDMDLGRIAEGYRADFTIWEADPLTVSADELVTTPIVATIVGGRATFAEPELQFDLSDQKHGADIPQKRCT